MRIKNWKMLTFFVVLFISICFGFSSNLMLRTNQNAIPDAYAYDNPNIRTSSFYPGYPTSASYNQLQFTNYDMVYGSNLMAVSSLMPSWGGSMSGISMTGAVMDRGYNLFDQSRTYNAPLINNLTLTPRASMWTALPRYNVMWPSWSPNLSLTHSLVNYTETPTLGTNMMTSLGGVGGLPFAGVMAGINAGAVGAPTYFDVDYYNMRDNLTPPMTIFRIPWEYTPIGLDNVSGLMSQFDGIN